MKISNLMCTSCKASYEVAEAATVKGTPGRVECIGCGAKLASWLEPKAIVFRLVLPPEQKYLHVPVPPSPAVPFRA